MDLIGVTKKNDNENSIVAFIHWLASQIIYYFYNSSKEIYNFTISWS